MELPRQPVYVTFPATSISAESSRLLLRPVVESDVEALYAIRSKPEVAKYQYPKEPFRTFDETRKWLATKIFKSGPSEVIGRSFNLAIVQRATSEAQGRLIGYVSVNTLDPCPEIGYSLLPEYWGQGYATEALKMMLKMWWDLPRRSFGNGDPGDQEEKVYAISQKCNLGSCKVLRKCGFAVERELQVESDGLYLWSLLKPRP